MGVISAWSLRVRSGVGPVGVVSGCMVNCLRAKRAFWCVQWHGLYIFQAVRRAVNVLKLMFRYTCTCI